MSIISSTAHSTDSGFYDFEIEQSLRFDGSSYLSRTFGTATDSKIFTLSMWVKKITVGGTSDIFSTATANITDYDILRFNPDQINVLLNGGIGLNASSSALFRDSSAWYHLVFETDTTQSTKHKVYVNNVNVLSSGTVSTNYVNDFNTGIQHTIGANLRGGTKLNGYMAEINFIDGSALTSTSFGETKNGVWIPKAYSGSYGTNGFHLDFRDATSTTTLGYDYSGNNNHWTLN